MAVSIGIKGNTLYIRLHRLNRYSKFRIKDVGRPYRLQFLFGKLKGKRKWDLVSYHLNLKSYRSLRDAIEDLLLLDLTRNEYKKAYGLILKYWRQKRR